MNQGIIDAYEEVRDGFSSDRVIADPAFNSLFIDACRRRGMQDPPVELNLQLLNARKKAALPTGSRRTMIRNQDEFAFASEMAIRALERKYKTTLDRVLCNPVTAEEFDHVASLIAPGYEPLQYRWAALRLRKAKLLKPEDIGKVAPPVTVVGPVQASQVVASSIPTQQGLYIFMNNESVLYVGEAQNLRRRLQKHFEHSDNKHLAHYLWEFGSDKLLLEYHVLEAATTASVRKALERELINSRRAEFNKQR